MIEAAQTIITFLLIHSKSSRIFLPLAPYLELHHEPCTVETHSTVQSYASGNEPHDSGTASYPAESQVRHDSCTTNL